MPVDPSALIEAVMSGLSKIPTGIIAAVLLAGPTAVWLILRFANPRDARSRYGAVAADLHWICPECRSLNEDRVSRCYRCFLGRQDGVLPVLVGGATADSAGVGIAVGPGLPVGPQPASWLEAASAEPDPQGVGVRADDATDDPLDPLDEPVPAVAVASPPAAPIAPVFEPLILEPRVKPSRRPSSRRARPD